MCFHDFISVENLTPAGTQLRYILAGCQRLPCDAFWSVTCFFSNSSSPMVHRPINPPAEVHFTTIFAPRNGKILEVGSKDVSPIGQQKCGMTFPQKPSLHHPCFVLKKHLAHLVDFLIIFITL